MQSKTKSNDCQNLSKYDMCRISLLILPQENDHWGEAWVGKPKDRRVTQRAPVQFSLWSCWKKTLLHVKLVAPVERRNSQVWWVDLGEELAQIDSWNKIWTLVQNIQHSSQLFAVCLGFVGLCQCSFCPNLLSLQTCDAKYRISPISVWLSLFVQLMNLYKNVW